MQLLPKWALLNPVPAIHDFESLTVLEQIAKIYGAMNQLISEYNDFADRINTEITNFVLSGETEITNFKESIEKRICCKFNEIDAKIAKLNVDITKYSDDKISEIYEQYLNGVASQIINEKIAAGEIDITLVYDPDTESLNMIVGGE